mmetsp:Transcript_31504/g.81015  ORF Transcript_31504/g.81015 Transcript_31504/m.81015 type:complete len:104 (+) Transcript_31504:3-314(+)
MLHAPPGPLHHPAAYAPAPMYAGPRPMTHGPDGMPVRSMAPALAYAGVPPHGPGPMHGMPFVHGAPLPVPCVATAAPHDVATYRGAANGAQAGGDLRKRPPPC